MVDSNKILHGNRTKLSRKTSQTSNLTDTIRRMWLGSDPKVNNIRLKTKPIFKICNKQEYSTRYCQVKLPIFGPLNSDYALFESLSIR